VNILVLTTYPVDAALHGGQLRVRQIAETYRRAGHRVQVAGVLGSENYRPAPGFAPFPGYELLSRYVENPFLMEDFAIGACLADSDERLALLAAQVNLSPDVVHVEQPWLFDAAQGLLERQGWRACLVYSSQNVEHRLKRNILASYFGPAHVEHCVRLVEAAERRAAEQADGVICVSDEDRAWLQPIIGRPPLVAPNGVSPRSADEAGRAAAATITGDYRFALYCASAHPPNLEGFFELFGGGFGSLAPDQRLVVAGGAGKAIPDDPRFRRSALLIERSLLPGYVTDACLAGLLEAAHCIVLPVTQGGGTNLKTAEALWAGKPIVATSLAFRGFEEFAVTEGVHICDTSAAFKRTLREIMAASHPALSDSERQRRRVVLWEACLGSLPDWVEGLRARIAA
jgi:glycosyltransferase involved in cell wall biosynthesis